MLDTEYIYMMQKFCSVSNFKPQNSRVRSPDSRDQNFCGIEITGGRIQSHASEILRHGSL